MNILLLGSGGREHALAWKISQSEHSDALYIAPGNAGTANHGTNVPLNAEDFLSIKDFVITRNIHMVVVGPEAPLVAGLKDFFDEDEKLKNVRFFGPGKAGAALEGSKDYAKAFMQRHNIPTAGSETFTEDTLEEGLQFISRQSPPYVLKADGLAAGKGVLIIDDVEEAKEAFRRMLKEKEFGEASAKVVVEEFLEGTELSVFVITDGNNYQILPEAKDYKRIGEGDTGPNTGGMGCISPVPFAGRGFMEKVEEKVVKPTIDGLKKEGIPYCGFIFFGLMNVKGDPYVIEYNVRMGDPEAEVVIPRIKSDLLVQMKNATEYKLGSEPPEISTDYAAAVMMVSGGYPGKYKKGEIIHGLEKAHESLLFHAGTRKEQGNTVTNGGRVLAVTSLGPTMDLALASSYATCRRISFNNSYYRTDLGQDLKRFVK